MQTDTYFQAQTMCMVATSQNKLRHEAARLLKRRTRLNAEALTSSLPERPSINLHASLVIVLSTLGNDRRPPRTVHTHKPLMHTALLHLHKPLCRPQIPSTNAIS